MSAWRYRSSAINRLTDAHSDWDLNPRDEIALAALQGLMAGWSPPAGDSAEDKNTRASGARSLAKAAYAGASEFLREKNRVDGVITADIAARVAELQNHPDHRLYNWYHGGNDERDKLAGQQENALWSLEVWVEQNGTVAYHHPMASSTLPPASYPPASDSE